MKDEYYNEKDEDYIMDLEEKIGSRSNVLTQVVHKSGEVVQPPQHLLQQREKSGSPMKFAMTSTSALLSQCSRIPIRRNSPC
jgi:hypothetical protein